MESVGSSDEWIFNNLGIKERRISRPNEPTSDMAAEAGLRAIEDAGLTPNDIVLFCAIGAGWKFSAGIIKWEK